MVRKGCRNDRNEDNNDKRKNALSILVWLGKFQVRVKMGSHIRPVPLDSMLFPPPAKSPAQQAAPAAVRDWNWIRRTIRCRALPSNPDYETILPECAGKGLAGQTDAGRKMCFDLIKTVRLAVKSVDARPTYRIGLPKGE
jgi:hypothetical protein